MKTCIVLLSLCLFFACSNSKMESADTLDSPSSQNEAVAVKTSLTTPQLPTQIPNQTKLIKTADYRFEVTDVKKTTEYIESAVHKSPAFVSSSNISSIDGHLQNEMTIRVQNEFFDDLLKYIDHQAVYVNSRNISTQDVAKEFVDLESRLKTKREVEARYTDILRNKAGTIEELLAAEKQIGDLHEEIEATVSRINFLKDQVSYSTIRLEFYQPVIERPIVAEEENMFATAFMAGLNGVTELVIALIYIWPLFVVLSAVFFFIRYKKKRFISF